MAILSGIYNYWARLDWTHSKERWHRWRQL